MQASPIAVVLSDIHICHTPPPCRSNEPDWYAAMFRPLLEVAIISEKWKCPVIIAGDIFDHWRCTPELINFAIRTFRIFGHGVYAVPGQHDLPHHRYEEMNKGAYGTLCEAGVITNLSRDPYIVFAHGGAHLRLSGFPWGSPIESIEKRVPNVIDVAVVHAYVWNDRTGYPGAPDDKRAHRYTKKLEGYHVAVFGDNHTPFSEWLGAPGELHNRTRLFNCGGFFVRRSDEVGIHKPRVGIIRNDGHIITYELKSTKEDRYNIEVKDSPKQLVDLREFVAEFRASGELGLDFKEEIRRYIGENGKTDEAACDLLCTILDL